jgi:hypothetical protein
MQGESAQTAKSQETSDSNPGKEMASANQDALKTQAPAQSINASDNPGTTIPRMNE